MPRYDMETDDRGRLISRKVPPPQMPRVRVNDPVAAAPLTGARVLVVLPTEWLIDVRAVSEPRQTPDGWVIDVTDEAAWYASSALNRPIPPERITAYPAGQVWTDG